MAATGIGGTLGQEFDGLTGLRTRPVCMRIVGERIAAAADRGESVSVLWIDLDRFQEINHSFGHQSGDHLVATVAARLRVAVAPHEVFRVAGDEFVVLAAGVDSIEAIDLARHVHALLHEPVVLDGLSVHPSASIGIAVHEGGEDALAVMLRADRAMLTAKRRGGNTFAVADDGGALSSCLLLREEIVIENKLHLAIEHGGLQLHYQPILLRDGRIEAVEALMRCTVGGESIPPAKFISVAEKSGLILQLGDWTLSEGALFAAALSRLGLATKVAVNVSRAQLLGPGFAEKLHAALLTAAIDPVLLELELTESLFMDMSPVIQANLRCAREAGVGMAIDDFGTGYSCLANLRDIPATKLKLDRSFVAAVVEDPKTLAIVRAMTALGREIGLTVVAEGVETEAQRDVLLAAGVDAMQGYLFSPPVSRGAITGWLRALFDEVAAGLPAIPETWR